MKKPIDVAHKLYNEYKDINEKVRNINLGGCGIFAEKLYLILCELGYKPKLGVITDNIRLMNMRIRGEILWNENATVRHVVVILDGRLMDSEGIYNTVHDTSYRKPKLCKRVPLKKLQEWNADIWMWNDDFNRGQVKTIDKTLKKVYKKVKKDLEIKK